MIIVPLFMLNYPKPWETSVISNARYRGNDEDNYHSTSRTKHYMRHKSLCGVKTDGSKLKTGSNSLNAAIVISVADKKSEPTLVCEIEEFVHLNPEHTFQGLEI